MSTNVLHTEGRHRTETLTVFKPSSEAAREPARITLRQFFQEHFLPDWLEAIGAAPRNIEQYRNSISLACQQGFADLPLTAIDRAAVSRFVQWLRKRPGRRDGTIAASTVNKHLTAIQKVLRVAGPAGNKNRMGYGILAEVPWLPKLSTTTELRPDLSMAEIEEWWDVVATATRPRVKGVIAPDWWRAWILFSYNTALRISTTLRVEWKHLKGDWLHLPGSIMKGGRAAKIYINSTGRAAVEKIRTDSPLMFSWTFRLRHIHTCRRAVVDQDNHPERANWTSHALRRTLDTWLTERNPAIAKLQLAHAQTDIDLRHYVQPRIVKPLLEEVPQPRQAWAWLSGVTTI